MDTDLFFPEIRRAPGNKGQRYKEERLAKNECGVCTVQDECLEYALRNRVYDGVWGGLNFDERVTERRRRQAESE